MQLRTVHHSLIFFLISAPPTILSHVIDLETLTSPSSRDMFEEFFSNPHHCIVTKPMHQIPIPTPVTLKDLLSLVDELRTRRDEQIHSGLARGQYGWNYQEITQEELPMNVVCGLTIVKKERLNYLPSSE